MNYLWLILTLLITNKQRNLAATGKLKSGNAESTENASGLIPCDEWRLEGDVGKTWEHAHICTHTCVCHTSKAEHEAVEGDAEGERLPRAISDKSSTINGTCYQKIPVTTIRRQQKWKSTSTTTSKNVDKLHLLDY